MHFERLNKLIEQTKILEEETFVPELNGNFKRWFGDSKVVDDNGQPLVCYHGSTVDIEEFNLGYSGITTGNNREEVFYFTSDKDTAITYSQEATVKENEWKFWDAEEKKNIEFEDYDDYAEYLREQIFENPHINPCYLKMENPFIFDADYTLFDAKKNYTLCSMLKGNNNIDYDIWDYDLADDLINVFTEYDEETDEYIEKENNYDGIIIKNVVDNISEFNQDYIDVYIVWDPYQIKSVYNRGIWDMNNANVHEQIKEDVKVLYHGSQTDNIELKETPLYLTTNKQAAKEYANGYCFGGDLTDDDKPTVYEMEVTINKPKILTTEEEYDEYMDIANWTYWYVNGQEEDWEKDLKANYDALIYDDVIMVFNAKQQCKIINKTQAIDEKFKELNEALLKFLH